MWKKKGILLRTEDLQCDWICSHVTAPTPLLLDSKNLRIYFSPRTNMCKSLPIYADFTLDDLTLTNINYTPLCTLGSPGTFDDCGVTFSSIISYRDKLYMYYIGWAKDYVLPYKNSIGLAISDDGGNSYHKASEGPVLTTNFKLPYFVASPYVMDVGKHLRMWFLSGTGWTFNDNDGWVPAYLIKSAISNDGINWDVEDRNCIQYRNNHEAIAKPCVRKINDKYYMWYSYRDTRDFRRNKDNAYMIGLAISTDGINWERKDELVGIEKSADGWDSEMMCYPNVIELGDKLIMFYNGNEHGKYAFGYAVCDIADLEKVWEK